METPSSTFRRRTSLLIAAAAGLLAFSTSSGAAAAPAVAPGDDLTKVERLTNQIRKLEKEYGGDLAQLRNARYAAAKAVKKSQALKDDLARARVTVAQLASSRYMTSGIDPTVAMMTTADPSNVLDGITMADHISRNQASKVNEIQALVDAQEKARKQAQEKMAKLADDIKDLEKEKARVQALLKKFKPESPSVGMGGITPRMLNVKTLIDQEFGPFPTIGCTRPGDPQDHGSGRACDFMESTGGSMPSSTRMAHGDRVAQWTISNGSRLGIKYVIWRQRIYDMRSPGWKSMSDRGSITANHYDHVHISVF